MAASAAGSAQIRWWPHFDAGEAGHLNIHETTSGRSSAARATARELSLSQADDAHAGWLRQSSRVVARQEAGGRAWSSVMRTRMGALPGPGTALVMVVPPVESTGSVALMAKPGASARGRRSGPAELPPSTRPSGVRSLSGPG